MPVLVCAFVIVACVAVGATGGLFFTNFVINATKHRPCEQTKYRLLPSLADNYQELTNGVNSAENIKVWKQGGTPLGHVAYTPGAVRQYEDLFKVSESLIDLNTSVPEKLLSFFCQLPGQVRSPQPACMLVYPLATAC